MYNTQKGIHQYIDIKNLLTIIKENEKSDEDLKWTIHMLHTYFTGLVKLVKDYGGIVEKCNSGRAHIVFDVDSEDIEAAVKNAMEATVACFIYNYNIFNKITKYTQYSRPTFTVSAGMDYGDYIFTDIDDSTSNPDSTTIGSTANNAAKVQAIAGGKYIYILDKLYDILPSDIQKKFTLIDEETLQEINKKMPESKVYSALYSSIYEDKKLQEIEDGLSGVKERVDEESRKHDIKDITFTEVKKAKLSFDELSIKNNKKFTGGVLCADLRGFTKLFEKDDSNIEELFEVMEEVYNIMGKTVQEENGTRMQYQGDRIVAIFHDYTGAEPYIIRMLRCALKLNEKLPVLNEDKDISKKLDGSKIAVGIGCAKGSLIATRVGLNKNKDNIVLGETTKEADKCEDKYAEDNNTIAINKGLMEEIESLAEGTEYTEYIVFDNIFNAISKTGYYNTTEDYKGFDAKLKEEKEKIKKAKETQKSNSMKSNSGSSVNTSTKPWGNCL